MGWLCASAAAAGADLIPVALEDGTTGKLKTDEAGELVVQVLQFADETRGNVLFKDKATTVWFAPSALPEEGAEAASPQQVIFQEGSTQAALKDGAVVLTQGDAVVVNMGPYVVQRGAGAGGGLRAAAGVGDGICTAGVSGAAGGAIC